MLNVGGNVMYVEINFTGYVLKKLFNVNQCNVFLTIPLNNNYEIY